MKYKCILECILHVHFLTWDGLSLLYITQTNGTRFNFLFPFLSVSRLGTMGNLLCVLAHCSGRGEEIIAGDKSHIFLLEQGNIAQVGCTLNLQAGKNNCTRFTLRCQMCYSRNLGKNFRENLRKHKNTSMTRWSLPFHTFAVRRGAMPHAGKLPRRNLQHGRPRVCHQARRYGTCFPL